MGFLIDWLVQPLSLIVIASVLGFLLAIRYSSLLIQIPVGTVVLLVWVSSAPVSANKFIAMVEETSQQSQCGEIAKDTPVVVLGGGINAYVESESPYDVLTKETLQRTLIASELNSGENAFYLLGGGSTSRKISDFMQQVLIRHGVTKDQIIIETISSSTYQNAIAMEELLPPTRQVDLVLVTSSYHLNRAERTFSARGYEVCGVGVGALYAPAAGWVGFLPHIDALNKTTLAWREAAARQWYRLQFDI